jgi:hypothetical protein
MYVCVRVCVYTFPCACAAAHCVLSVVFLLLNSRVCVCGCTLCVGEWVCLGVDFSLLTYLRAGVPCTCVRALPLLIVREFVLQRLLLSSLWMVCSHTRIMLMFDFVLANCCVCDICSCDQCKTWKTSENRPIKQTYPFPHGERYAVHHDIMLCDAVSVLHDTVLFDDP